MRFINRQPGPGGRWLLALLPLVLLLVAMGSLGWEAVQRLTAPQPIPGWTLIAVAGIGIVVNTATALLLLAERGQVDLDAPLSTYVVDLPTWLATQGLDVDQAARPDGVHWSPEASTRIARDYLGEQLVRSALGILPDA